MKVQLDTGAMNALFPEGSEARIQLQNAVIANFAYKMQDKYISNEVRKVVNETMDIAGTERQIGKKIRALLDAEFKVVNKGWYASIFNVNDQSKIATAINDYAATQASSIRVDLEKDAKRKIDDMMEYSKGRVMRAITDTVEKVEADMVRRVEQRITAKMDELIRLEFAKLVSGGTSSFVQKDA